jgi:hypothetical protein
MRSLRTSSIPVAALAAAIPVLALGGCGDGGRSPIEARLGKDTKSRSVLGFPALATKNTTRVGGKDPVEDAAAVAAAVYPARTPASRPRVVSLVNDGDWRAGIAASVLMSSPLRAPVLLAGEKDVPDSTAQALDSLAPIGAPEAKGAQVIRVGEVAKPGGLQSTAISGADPFALADAIDAFRTSAAGRPSGSVVIASAESPGFAMPAAGWAAKSGDSVLFVHKDSVPAPTRRAIARHESPRIYVIGPPSAVSDSVVRDLEKLGSVKRVASASPVENAIAFARYKDSDFGWGIRDPGHGLVFANVKHTQDAAAAAALGAAGAYGPLLLLDSATRVPPQLENYLLDIQPGYQFDPVRGVYNHAWLMGDESAISVDTQALIDQFAEITRVKQPRGR